MITTLERTSAAGMMMSSSRRKRYPMVNTFAGRATSQMMFASEPAAERCGPELRADQHRGDRLGQARLAHQFR
jgi:hypothetical protein